MRKEINKKSLIAMICVFLLTISCMVYASYSYLTDQDGEPMEFIVGDVEANLSIYFEDENGNKYTLGSTDVEIEYVGTSPNDENKKFIKSGVIKVNISDRNDKLFAENFRVDLNINSNVPTYVRIAAYEQLTLTYQSGGATREVAVVQTELTDFNYNFKSTSNPDGKFYDNRSVDGFIYCTEQVQKNGDQTLTIPLISDYYSDRSFGTRDKKYSLQIGFIVEAVQYLDGAQNNWGLEKAPWGEDW